MTVTFHGGAGQVTGANYLVSSDDTRILIDCGLVQGGRFSESQNSKPFPYDPASIGAVFVTHAHIDHTGRLPQLVQSGFKGTVYSTPPTRDFAELLLYDSEHVIRGELEREGLPPLYTPEDVAALMERWAGVGYHKPITVGPFKVTLYDAGHILGSSSIMVEAEGTKIIFSGDLGNPPTPIIKPTEYISEADYCLVESTYGNRVHEDFERRKDLLEDAIEDAVKSGGVLMIPAFAMERTQELLFELNELAEHGRIPKIPIFIDSPLAIKLTGVYQKYQNYFNQEAWNLVRSGDAIFNFPGLKMTLTVEQSKEINDVPPPKIIIAGSGMSQGGRILHHERRYLSDPKTVAFFEKHHADYPELFRKSWAPYQDKLSSKFQSTLEQYSQAVSAEKDKGVREKLRQLEELGYTPVPVASAHEELRLKGHCTVTLYKNGKVLVQGKDKEKVEKFLGL